MIDVISRLSILLIGGMEVGVGGLASANLCIRAPLLNSYPVSTPPFGGIAVLRTEHVLPMHYLLKVRYYFSAK